MVRAIALGREFELVRVSTRCYALDVDGDGYVDFDTGGVWYRNSRDPDKLFERMMLNPCLNVVHDLVATDINGDGGLR